jgi:outer membrane protein TolC
MSNLLITARRDRREEQLIKDVIRRRPLFSALSVLVGSGAVALSALPSQAQARSALDEMAWAPQQHTRVAQQPPVQPAVNSALNQAVSILQAPAQDATPRAGAVDSPAPVTVPVVAAQVGTASTPTQPATTRALAAQQAATANRAPQRRAEPAPMPRSRGFADAGLISVDAPASSKANDVNVPDEAQTVDKTVQVAREVAPAATSGRNQSAPVLAAVPAPLSVAASPIRPALSIKRAPDMQADIIALRGNMASGSANKYDGSSASSTPLAQADIPARSSALGNGANAPSQKSTRRGRGVEDNYAEWLDDSRGAKTLADTTVVPEQAVRSALRNAADIAAERSASVRQARNDLQAAKFDIDQVKGQRWPQVQVGANSPALRGTANRFDDSNPPTASVSVTTMVYDWGKTSKNIDSRTKTAEAADFYYQTVLQQNAYEVSSNLVELAKNRAVYSIGESYVKRMSALVEMLEEIVKIDPGRLSELSQAKSRLLQAQTSQAVIAAQVRSLELSVRKLVGDEPMPMPSGTQWQLQLDGLDSAVAAVAQNPAIEQAVAEAAAAKATAKSVRAGSLPQLNWVINKTTAHDTFGQRQPWTTMLQLSWTPFQGGSQQAAERAALARASSSDDKREQLELDSEFKVRDAHRDAIALATRAKLYSELSVETDLIRKQFFEQWYHLNRRTLVDVLSAESDFYNNQVSAVTTQFDAYQSVLKIHLNNGTLEQWLREA